MYELEIERDKLTNGRYLRSHSKSRIVIILPFLTRILLMSRKMNCLRPLLTRDIWAHNIAIKRYCNKKICLSYGFQRLEREALNEPQIKVLHVLLRAYLDQ